MRSLTASSIRGLFGPMDEERAIRAVQQGGFLTRVAVGLSAGARLAIDPSDTKQVFLLAIAVDSDRLSLIRDRLASSPQGRALIAAQPAIDSRSVDYRALHALPADTLGGAYARALADNGLDPDLFQRPPGLPDDLGFVTQRIRQTHDLWHVLTGLDTDIPGEIALQAFSHAQLGQRFSRLIAVFGTLFYGLRYPQTLGMARHWYRVGKRIPFLLAVPWEELWHERLDDVRERFGLLERAALDPQSSTSTSAL